MDRVARDGGVAVRPAAPWTASVHALLAHVRSRGVTWVPEPRDAPPGRGGAPPDLAAVSWVEGEVPAYPMPAWVWAPAVLERAAAMLREYHDATDGFDRAGRTWALPAREPAEVVCHNDFAPYNLVFRDGLPVGAIDFEAASPGPRAWDLAYLAYRLVPLAAPGNPDLPPAADPAARLAALCAAYNAPAAPAAPAARAARPSRPAACAARPSRPAAPAACAARPSRPAAVAVEPSTVLALVPERLRALAETAPPAHAALYRADAAHVAAAPPR